MREVRVVKSYTTLTQTLKNPAELDIQDDRAVADFRAFYHTAIIHAERVNSGLARNVLIEIVENLQNMLRKNT